MSGLSNVFLRATACCDSNLTECKGPFILTGFQYSLVFSSNMETFIFPVFMDTF